MDHKRSEWRWGTTELAPAAICPAEIWSDLIQPDILLAAQYYQRWSSRERLSPEERLMLAILADAVACYQRHASALGGKGKRVFREAEEWIMDRSDGWIFSFEQVCETLGFDPDHLRRGLQCWKQSRLRQRPGASALEGFQQRSYTVEPILARPPRSSAR